MPYPPQADGDWFSSNAPPQDDYAARLRQSYQQYLGRDASDAEVQDWMTRHPTYTGTVENAIRTSPEAQHYATTGAATPLPASAPATAGAAPAGGGQGDPEGFKAAWYASGGKTTTDLKNFVAAHPEFGATITGSKGSKLTFPGGIAVQAVRSAGLDGGIGPAWDDISGGGGGGGTDAQGNFLTPYNKQFSLMSPQEFINSPFSQAALAEIRQGGERGAAARGTLLTPGTEQAINRKSVDYLGDAYAQMANMDLGVQQGNYGIFKDNQDRPFDKLYRTSAMGLEALNNSANNASAYSTNAQNNATNTGSAQASGTIAGSNATTGAIGGIANAGIDGYTQWLANRRGRV